jgi:hypothetical protein
VIESGKKSLMKIKSYKVWEQKHPTVPRSRLFNLEPICVGTANVESLSSYFKRLCELHCVTPGWLFADVIAPILDKPYLSGTTSSALPKRAVLSQSLRARSVAINGCGQIARDWIHVLERLTCRQNLSSLTLQPWNGLLANRNLLRINLAWCPSCLTEWRDAKKTVYEPLMWAVRIITVCAQHNRILSVTCPHCGKSLHWLSGRGKPGYCGECGGWLGKKFKGRSLSRTRKESGHHVWLHEAVGDLLSASGKAHAPTETRRVAHGLEQLMQNAAGGNLTRLASLIRRRKTTVWGWMHGSKIPLDQLVTVCYHTGLSPTGFFTGQVSNLKTTGTKMLEGDMRFDFGTRRKRRLFQEEKVLKQLCEVLTGKLAPNSMQSVAERLHYNKRLLYKHYPILCKKISARAAKERQEVQRKRNGVTI